MPGRYSWTQSYKTLSKIPTEAKILKTPQKVDKLLPDEAIDDISKVEKTLDKVDEAVVPIINKVDDATLKHLARYPKMRSKLDHIQKNILGVTKFDEFEKFLRTLPDDVLKKLDESPEMMDDFAKKWDTDPDFVADVQKGNVDRLDELREIQTITSKITNKTKKHIFEGEINPQGKATGVHHIDAISSGKARTISGTRVEGPNGTYKAKVEVLDENGNWIAKTANDGYSSFFPDSWNQQKVMQEITLAFENKVFLQGNTWIGMSSEGIKVQMYLDASGNIISAFPKI